MSQVHITKRTCTHWLGYHMVTTGYLTDRCGSKWNWIYSFKLASHTTIHWPATASGPVENSEGLFTSGKQIGRTSRQMLLVDVWILSAEASSRSFFLVHQAPATSWPQTTPHGLYQWQDPHIKYHPPSSASASSQRATGWFMIPHGGTN